MTPEQQMRATALTNAIEYTKSWKVAPSLETFEDVIQAFYVWIAEGESIEFINS